MDFTRDVDEFRTFVGNVQAVGGGTDICEDVFGGLEAAINLSWSKEIKCLIHVGDAPAHGDRFHDSYDDGIDGIMMDEDSSRNSVDRRGLKIETLIDDMKKMDLKYSFGKITPYTDKMLRLVSCKFF